MKELTIGDKIELHGGYDFDALYLKNPPANKRSGKSDQLYSRTK
ncbi:MAG TPA: hypothetical protein VD905_08110 [Flavobacteriales bacterium]|nr:hypothetical protein [Flavobacteriales bacterium]